MEVFYYPRTIRKITASFLDMFNGMQVYNYTSGTSQTVSQIIDVPLKYGVGDKSYLFNVQQESGKKYYPKIPAILVSLNSIDYDSSRATSVNELRNFFDPALDVSIIDSFIEDVQPAPYNLSYTVELYTEAMDHVSQLLENILPFFNPTNYLRIKEFDFINIERNLKVELKGTSFDYPSEMSEEQYRYFSSKLTFEVQGYTYRPLSNEAVIKYINASYNYSNINKEIIHTSALPSSATPPANYTYSFEISPSATGYIKQNN